MQWNMRRYGNQLQALNILESDQINWALEFKRLKILKYNEITESLAWT